MKKAIITTLFICWLFFLQTMGQPYAIGERVTMKSDLLDETRSILVYTPETYDLGAEHYPVMYLLDGTAHFHHVSGIVRFLAGNGLIPEMIIVAIENTDRIRDLSPTKDRRWETSGGAGQFMNFLTEELIPFVERGYRTEPYRILVGHSLGGEFAVYSLLYHPRVFNAYIAISPYLLYDDDYLVKQAKSKLKGKYDHVRFYMTVGNEPPYFASLAEFEKIVQDKRPEGFAFRYVKYPDEDHGSNPHQSIYEGLEWIFEGWKVGNDIFSKGLAAIDAHYAGLSENYGLEIKTPEYLINLMGYNYLNKKDLETAIVIFRENVKRYPKSANVYDSLGEALEKSSEFEEAEANYRKAVEIATAQNHPNLPIYKTNQERVQALLSGS